MIAYKMSKNARMRRARADLAEIAWQHMKVEIDPPATVTCALARALSTWLNETVQPEAEVLFSSRVVKLHNATSYACRNRYGSAYQPLSEHALANAIDISEFVLASGEHITVLDNWPKVLSTKPAAVPDPAREPEVKTAKPTAEKASVVTVAKAKESAPSRFGAYSEP